MLSPSEPIRAVIVAPPRAVQFLSYDRFASALSSYGINTTIATEHPPIEDGSWCLVHTLAGDADKANTLLEQYEAPRTILLEMMPDGATAALAGGMPAAILKDGYARWANEGKLLRAMPSGLVVATSLAGALEFGTAMESGALTATDCSHPLPEQVARVISDCTPEQ